MESDGPTMGAAQAADPAASDTTDAGIRRPGVDGRQAALWFAALVAGLAVGLAYRRAEALLDLPWLVPVAILAGGAAVLVGFVAFRLATGSFEARTSGVTLLLALGGALAAAIVVPGAPPPAESVGTLTATRLDGRSYEVAATCRWDPRMQHVQLLTADLPAEIGTLSGQTLVIDFGGGTVTASGTGPTVTLAAGDGALDPPRGSTRPPDDSSGRLVLDPARGAEVTGSLAWVCFPAGPNVGLGAPGMALRGW